MKKINNPDPWITVAQAAEWTALSHYTIRRAITADSLTAVRIGSVLRIRLSDLETWMSASVSR